MAKIVFGIDLGTTYSAVSYVDQYDRAVIHKNLSGKDITPSAVYINHDGNIAVGESAKEEATMNPEGYVDFFKRYMGTPFEELPEEVQAYFTLNGKAHRPEELSSLVLKELKRSVDESSLGVEMEQVVITVPAYFNEAQRMATKTAGELAGLQVMEIIKEPLAAAFDYTQTSGEDNKTFLIYDLGGGTFDATIMSLSSQEVIEVASDGDSQLGGKDWDYRLFEYLRDRFLEEHPDKVLSDGDEKQLQLKAEEVKVKLTNSNETKAKLNFDGNRLVVEISRQEFEEMTRDLLDRSLTITDSLVALATEKGYTIDTILMVGGSTRMPMIKEALKERYGLDPKTHDPDQAVAKGAAVWAVFAYEKGQKIVEKLATGQITEEELSKEEQEIVKHRFSFEEKLQTSVAQFESLSNKEIVTAATKTYGIRLLDADNKRIIKNLIIKNSPLHGGQVIGTTLGSTSTPNQTELYMPIYESDEMDEIVPYNEYMEEQKIGEIFMELPPGLELYSPIEVKLTLNDQGLLYAYVEEKIHGRKAEAELQLRGMMTEEEIKQAEEYISQTQLVDEI